MGRTGRMGRGATDERHDLDGQGRWTQDGGRRTVDGGGRGIKVLPRGDGDVGVSAAEHSISIPGTAARGGVWCGRWRGEGSGRPPDQTGGSAVLPRSAGRAWEGLRFHATNPRERGRS